MSMPGAPHALGAALLPRVRMASHHASATACRPSPPSSAARYVPNIDAGSHEATSTAMPDRARAVAWSAMNTPLPGTSNDGYQLAVIRTRISLVVTRSPPVGVRAAISPRPLEGRGFGGNDHDGNPLASSS